MTPEAKLATRFALAVTLKVYEASVETTVPPWVQLVNI